MKKILAGLAGAILLIVVICVVRTLMLPSAGSGAEQAANLSHIDRAAIASRLSEAITYDTVSFGDGRTPDEAAFGGFAAFLAEAHPAIHAATTRETVNAHSLVYRWAGEDASAKPVGFLAHIDVVPVEPGTEGDWTHPPFDGVIDKGVVWGRGALDNKGPLIALMDAAERLAASGFKPSRDIYFMFGHDEELGGDDGAGKIAELMNARGVHFEWTLDEGTGAIEGVIPGVTRPIVVISVAEKGSTSLRLTATAPGGHSSAPARDTAVSIAARAVVAVTDHPYPMKLDESTVGFLHAVAPEMKFLPRMILANLWLTGPLVKAQLGKKPPAAASMHTTTAATMIEGGTKVNVLPQQASAVVNYRIHPRDTAESVRSRAASLIDDDRVAVEVLGAQEPSPEASTTSDGYAAISASARMLYGKAPVAPGLMIGGTDSKHYVGLADDNYRFTPSRLTTDDVTRFHGTNEQVRVEDLVNVSAFYEDLIRRVAG